MEPLNFPEYSFRIRQDGEGTVIFDPIRKKFVALTPEEWVRQHVLRMFTESLKYPASMISVEKSIKIQGRSLRYDAVVYNRLHTPALIVECKAPQVALSETVIEQVTKYNIQSQAGWVYITNGLKHFIYRIDFDKGKVEMASGFPAYDSL